MDISKIPKLHDEGNIETILKISFKYSVF